MEEEIELRDSSLLKTQKDGTFQNKFEANVLPF